MMQMFGDIYWVFWREMQHYFRERARIATSLVQPTVWLLFVGSNLAGLTRNPQAAQALGTTNYLQFMTPGIMVMTALFAGSFGGASILWDRRFGFLNKLYTAPIPRAAIPLGKLAAMLVQSWLQLAAILVIASLLGVRVVTGLPGILFIILLASLFEVVMGGISLTLAAHVDAVETFFAVINFLTLPLIFTSNAIFPTTAMPGWLQAVALVNPLTYAVTPMRIAVTRGWLWGEMWSGLLILLAMAIGSVLLAVSQFVKPMR